MRSALAAPALGVREPMKECPKCRQKEITFKSLASSDPASPAHCQACNSMFFLPGIYRNTLEFILNFGVPFVLVAALVLASWWPIVLFFVLYPVSYLLAAALCTPAETSVAEVKVSRRYLHIIRFIVLGVLVGAVLWFTL